MTDGLTAVLASEMSLENYFQNNKRRFMLLILTYLLRLLTTFFNRVLII